MNRPNFEHIAQLFGWSTTPEVEEDFQDVELTDLQTADQSLMTGNYRKAIKAYKHLIETGIEDWTELRMGLAEAHELAEESPQALVQYQQALLIREEDPEPYIGIAEIYQRNGDLKAAVEELELAKEVIGGNAHLHFKIAEKLRIMGHRKKAIRAAQEAVLSAPETAFYHYWLGDLLIEVGEFEEAVKSLRAAVELSPGDDLLFLRLSIGLWSMGRTAEAIKAIRFASELGPDKPAYLAILRRFLIASGDVDGGNQIQQRDQDLDEYDRDILRRQLAQIKFSEA